MSVNAIPLLAMSLPAEQSTTPSAQQPPIPLTHARSNGTAVGSAPRNDVKYLASQGHPGPLGAGGVGFSRKLYAAWKGMAATGIPIAACNIVASGVGTAIMEGKDHVVSALRSSGAAAGVTLAADVVLTTAVVVAGHLVLDKKFYKNSTAEEMLEKKTLISALASSSGGTVTAALIAQPLGAALTGLPLTTASFGKELLNQFVGTAVVHVPLALVGTAAWQYKRSRKQSPAAGEE